MTTAAVPVRRPALRRCLDALYLLGGYAAGAFIFAIFVMMVGSSIMRTVGLPTGGVDDLVSWSCAAAAFLGLAHAFRNGDFVRMSLVIERFGPKGRLRAEAFALVVGTIFATYLTYWSARTVYESYLYQDMANGVLVVPLWIPQLSIVIGSTLLLIALMDDTIRVLRGRMPANVTAVQERHGAGDFSKDA